MATRTMDLIGDEIPNANALFLSLASLCHARNGFALREGEGMAAI